LGNEIGERLKKLRIEVGMKKSHMAKTIGITPGYWGNLEFGRRTPSRQTILLLGVFFNVRPEWIEKGTGEMFLKDVNDFIFNMGSTFFKTEDVIAIRQFQKMVRWWQERDLEAIFELQREMIESQKQLEKKLNATVEYERIMKILNIPDMPSDLTKDDKVRWEKNAAALHRWSKTDAAQIAFPGDVPVWALERFCREASGYERGNPKEIADILWDYIHEGKK